AGLLPVVTGPGANSALHVFARTVLGDRIAELPIGHDFLQPLDLLGYVAADCQHTRPHGGLLNAVAADTAAGGPGLVVLESFNRGPVESYLLPWLTHPYRELHGPAAAPDKTPPVRWGPEVLLAATALSSTTA